MDVNISFRSVENKCLLWDLMLKNNLFTNISPDKETLVKKLFESKVDMISNERKNGQTLSSKNKSLFQALVPELKKLQINKKEVSFADNIQKSQQDASIILTDGGIVTAEKQMEIRKEQFKNSLETMQTNFSNMINHEAPKDIDFRDSSKDDDEIDMDERMKEIMKNRENEMNTLFKERTVKDKPVPENVESSIVNNNNIQNNSRRRLDIGEKTVIEDIILVRDTSNNITTNDSVTKMLEEVLNNQRIILGRLETIKII